MTAATEVFQVGSRDLSMEYDGPLTITITGQGSRVSGPELCSISVAERVAYVYLLLARQHVTVVDAMRSPWEVVSTEMVNAQCILTVKPATDS